jgi:DNA-binding MarR family transcriptional regulator
MQVRIAEVVSSTSSILSAEEKAGVRADVFHHLAGIALAPTIKALTDRGVSQMLLDASGAVFFVDLVEQTGANPGYLRVALRLLASSGWLEETASANRREFTYSLTTPGRAALRAAAALYEQATSFLPSALRMHDALFGTSDEAMLPLLWQNVERMQRRWGLEDVEGLAPEVAEQIRRHLDGVIVGPAMVALARAGIFTQLEDGPRCLAEISGNRVALAGVFDALATQGWVQRHSALSGDDSADTIELTPQGKYAAQISASYGVTVSYLPTFHMLHTLLFGNARLPRVDETGVEVMVDRAMNVWGSGGAHTTYFTRVDEIIVEIFNRPLSQQPRGICDMGCGDGTFLAHLYNVVKTRTQRGAALDEHPLHIIGADFNKVARRVTSRTLRDAGIPTYAVIPGDINRPAQLASELEKRGIDSHDLLHIRSFLDHNRPYSRLNGYQAGSRPARSTGAFSNRGEQVFADEMEENLIRHLRRWKPYSGRFGLIILELHTLPPAVAAANRDRTPAVAYDATHGYSDQYLVEVPIFLACAREAGLRPEPRFGSQFPPSELATVSINFFTASADTESGA